MKINFIYKGKNNKIIAIILWTRGIIDVCVPSAKSTIQNTAEIINATSTPTNNIIFITLNASKLRSFCLRFKKLFILVYYYTLTKNNQPFINKKNTLKLVVLKCLKYYNVKLSWFSFSLSCGFSSTCSITLSLLFSA